MASVLSAEWEAEYATVMSESPQSLLTVVEGSGPPSPRALSILAAKESRARSLAHLPQLSYGLSHESRRAVEIRKYGGVGNIHSSRNAMHEGFSIVIGDILARDAIVSYKFRPLPAGFSSKAQHPNVSRHLHRNSSLPPSDC